MDDNASITSVSTTNSYKPIQKKRKTKINKYEEQLNALEQEDTNEEDVITNAFKHALKEYIEIDNDLKEANSHLKVLRNRKKELGGQIQVHMREFSIDKLNLPKNNLKLNQRVAKRPINKALILERLTLYFKGDEKKAQQLTDFICDDEARKSVIKYSLTRRILK